MRKLEKRAIICIVFASILVIGLAVFLFRYVVDGDDWVAFPSNKHIYTDGVLSRGTIYDRDGEMLLSNEDGNAVYNDSASIRRATIHSVGDVSGNIRTGAETAFAGKLTGYNVITGTYSMTGKGRDLYLTIDADICAVADKALGNHSGTVAVYNYKTGDIICLTSSPNFDPNEPPEVGEDDSSGLYLNRFYSGRIVPGSIFKLVTTAAAIDNKSDLDSWSYTCTGRLELGDDAITCPNAHGTVDIGQALTVSCNCAYAELTMELGSDVMAEYVEKLGLTKSRSINGIDTAKGSFNFNTDNQASLAWAGIGQFEDLLNPCTMMIYMGAIANGGRAVLPQTIDKVRTSIGLPASIPYKWWSGKMLSSSTAAELEEMMHDNVVNNYGEGNFPGLDLCAKSGTAEVGGDNEPNAWFTGFIRNPDYPLAFIVLVENGGSGSKVAGRVANTVLQAIVNE
ncbi:MAG: penicillin-binding transpeptidase domain-containing protein [Bacillota bacterium]|nr:penicillin-binding transpeptidase domain-containing protein [Bacillota bacterium]